MFLTIVVIILITSPIWASIIIPLRNSLHKHKDCKSKRKLHRKTAVITGASAGIGKETARDFAIRGARVILACRNLEKAQKVADQIIKESGNKNVVVYKLDTSDLRSVRQCAKEILDKERRLDILVNNAGCPGNGSRTITKDGLELTMATNYYGHFLFTNLLMGLLKKSAPSRIVNVSSELHWLRLSLDPENLNFAKGMCNNLTTYSQSKLCNVLFSQELSRRLVGTGVTANSLHPGFVQTEIFEKTKAWYGAYMQFLAAVFSKTEVQGAQTTIHVAVSEDVEDVSGKYFENCEVTYQSFKSRDVELAKRLWRASVRDVKLKDQETNI